MVLLCLILLILSDFSAFVHSQGSTGFISIDCGLTGDTSYTNSYTGLNYVPDDQYIDTGVNHKISTKYATDQYVDQKLWKDLLTVRSFPDGTKNCYTLNSLTEGSKYLIRATFLYGSYDNSNRGPMFDLYLGVNFWATVTPTVPEYYYPYEIIAISPADYLQVCLINTGQGIPFISSLELRPLNETLYPLSNETQSLVLDSRCNYGTTPLVRFPNDKHDRIWLNCSDPSYSTISTTSTVQNVENDLFEVPSAVMQSAIIGTTFEPTIDYYWNDTDSTVTYFIILDLSEIQKLASTDMRAFDVFFNDVKLTKKPFMPDRLYSDAFYFEAFGGGWYNISLRRTINSTLPPILNAIEIFLIQPITLVPTDSGDVTAINAIKAAYKVNKGWSGDPCVPSNLTWPGLNCSSSSSSSNPPRITTINLSSSGLTGPIVSQFGNLNALKYLDLSKNKLSGSIPNFLDNLTALVFLDLSGNNLVGSIPPGLEQREKQGLLTVKIGSGSGASTKKNITTIIIVIIVVVVLLLLAATICVLLFLKRRNNKNVVTPQNAQHQEPKPVANIPNIPLEGYPNVHQGNLEFENRNFTYKEILMITNNLQNRIGTGGFGSVYAGRLENNKEVAVKLRSQESKQGEREFLAEAQSLTRVHHRNLVSLVGYCMDGNHMALVYEYMSEGTLQDKLRDNTRPISWKQRLRIAHESAQGLEYLHKSCNPPLIHRDVKSNNILLNANYEAKIADFGLVRAFGGDDASTHVSTRIVGTPGYLDPDYYTTSQLSERSDVYSFGVVLLEIITGQPPILGGPQGGHLTQLVQQRLSRGNIESIIDQIMHGQYDLNSVWKVATLALRCTDKANKRPNMSIVVAELKESMDLELSSGEAHSMASGSTSQYNYSRNDNFVSDVSHGSIFEMGYMGGTPSELGPQAR
ncbi:hypothetical protein LUZ60_000460 [Juncus effusus]|nr:hypothetical protein LUZ60_000460 [Juncus effusus]